MISIVSLKWRQDRPIEMGVESRAVQYSSPTAAYGRKVCGLWFKGDTEEDYSFGGEKFLRRFFS